MTDVNKDLQRLAPDALRRLVEHNDAVRAAERDRIADLLQEQAALHRDIADKVKARFGDAATGDETERAAADALYAFAAKLRAEGGR